MGERIYEVTGDVHDDHYNLIARERMAKAFQAIVANEIDDVLSREIECYDLPSQAVREGQMMLLALAVQMAADTGDNLQGTQAEVAARVAMTYGRGAKATITKETGAAYPDGDRQHAGLLIETQQLSLSKDPEDQKRFRGFQTMVETATSGVVRIPALQSSEKRPSTMPSVVRKMAVAAGIAGAVTAAQALYGVQAASAATPHETNKNTPDKTIVVDNNVPKNGIDLTNMKVTVAPAPLGLQKPDTQPRSQAQEQPVAQPVAPSSKELPRQSVSSADMATADGNISQPITAATEQSSKAAASTNVLASTAQSSVPTNNSDTIPAEEPANTARSAETPQHTGAVPDRPERLPVISQIEHKVDTAPSEDFKDTVPLLGSADQPDLLQINPTSPPDGRNATLATVVTTTPEVVAGTIPDIAAMSERHGEEAAVVPAAPDAPTVSVPDLTQLHDGNLQDAAPYTPPPAIEKAPAPAPAPVPAPTEQAPTAPATTPEANVDPSLAGETKWTSAQLEQVKNNLPVYLEAQHQTGVPWEMLAAVHQREHGLAVSNPANGQGPYQLFSGTERFTPGDISHDEFLRQTILAANFIKGKAAESRVGGALSLDNPDKIKDVLFSYNGRAPAYIRQATNLGFTLGAEGSPYVMNLADDRRDSTKNPAWGQILTDGGPLGKANHEPGAWLLVDGLVRIDAKARAQVSNDKKQEQPAQVATEKNPEQANSGVTWELPTTAAVSSPFGGRGEGGVHRGIDYATPTGTPLVAAIGGKVTVVVTADVRTQPFCTSALDSIGASVNDIKDPQQKEVRITAEIDGATYTVIYAHMSKVTVAPNQMINPGDVIGETGASGCVTGPHLHFEVQKNGVPVDPTTLYGKPVSASSKQS